LTARSVMLEAGWEPGELTDDMLGVQFIECLDPDWSTCTCHPELPARRGLNFYDAVGDLGSISDVWGPSLTQFQIRTLRDPMSGNVADRERDAKKLWEGRPVQAARAARVIVGPNGEYRRLWTPYREGTYLPHRGLDFELHAGHRRAHLWNS
jgi:hypothetical protein